MKIFIFQVFILLHVFAAGVYAQSLSHAEYFVDTDPGVGNAVPISISPGDTVLQDFSIGMGGLSPGWHQLYIRVQDAGGRWGNQTGRTFYVYDTVPHPLSPQCLPIVKAEYFYDTDPGAGKGTAIPLNRGDTVHVDRYFPVAGLSEGTHRVYIRTQNEAGQWSLHKMVSFTVTASNCTMPVPDFVFDTVTYGTPVTFTNLSDSLLPASRYQWDFDNDGIVDDTVFNASHVFSVPGVYPVKLTVENSSLCKASIIKDVITGPLPDTAIIVNGNLTFCEGDSVILTSANNPPGYAFSWNNGDTTQAVTVKSSGSYYCWVTNSYGLCTKSSVIKVLVHDVPEATIQAANATGGNANGRIEVTVNGGSGNYAYDWSNGATTAVNNNLLPGVYSVTVNDGFCPVYLSASISNIAINPGDLVEAEYFFDTDPGTGNATSLLIRAGDTIEFPVPLSVSGLSPGYHYLYVRTRDTDGLWGIAMRKSFFVYDTQPVTTPPSQPELTQAEYFIGNDPGVGKGIPIPVTAADTLSVTTNIPATGIAVGFHTLFVRAKDALGRWGIYREKPFYVYDAQPHNLAHTSKPLTKAEYFFDTDPGTRNGLPITFNINDSVDVNRFVRVAGLADGNHYIYLRTMDEVGNWSLWKRNSFTVQHVECSCPLVDFVADTVETLGMATLFTNQSTGALTGALYQWDVNNDGVTDYTTANASHVYSQFGIYQAKLTIRNTDSCYASMIREVVVSPAIDTSLLISGSLTFCEGDSVILSAQPGYNYHWNNGSMAQTLTVKQTGSFLLRLNNPYGVQAFTRTVEVTVNPLPVVAVTSIDASGGQANGTAICEITGDPEDYTFNWSTGGHLRIENNLPVGDYWVTVSDGRCPVTRNFHISNNDISTGDIVAAEYFFDTDPGVGNATTLNISAGDTIRFATYLPVTSLLPGYHNLYVRTKDTYGKWGIYLNKLFYVYDTVGNISRNQAPIAKAEYFYDTDPGVGKGHSIPLNPADSVSMDYPFETDGLQTGFHDMYVRVMNSNRSWSLTQAQKVYVYDSVPQFVTFDQSNIVALEYFFDNDPGAGNGINIPFTPTANLVELDRYFPVTGLPAGTHNMYLRAKDEAGAWSIYRSIPFTVQDVNCTCPEPAFAADTVDQGHPTHFLNNSGNTWEQTAYEWDINNDGSVEYTARNISHTFPASGVYTVKLRVINNSVCQASLIRQVVVGPLPDRTIAITGNTTFCEGDSVILAASAGNSYRWWPGGETTQTITVKDSGEYYAWISNAAGIEVQSEIVNTAVHERFTMLLSVINASGGNSNGSAFVEVTGGSGIYSYNWSSGSQKAYADSLAAGSYSVVVDDGFCPETKNFVVENLPVNEGDIVAAEYFFNTDPGVGNGNPINISSGDTIEHRTGFSVAGLPNGFNHLYVRVMDTYKRWALYKDAVFFVYDTALNRKSINQPPLDKVEYFVDLDQTANPDPGVGNGTPVDFPDADSVSGSFNYIADNLVLGFHNMYVRAKDTGNKWGHFTSSLFYVYDTTHYNLLKIQPPITAAEYFFDTDPGIGNGIPISFNSGDLVDWTGGIALGSLSLGTHYIYVRTKDAGNKWSIPRRVSFGVYDCVQPTANFSFIPTCIENNVVFNDLSTNIGANATYQWDIDNNGSIDYTTTGSISHKFNIPGSHEVKLKITHNVACVDSIVKTISFPVVNLGNDTTIFTEQSLVLDAGAGYVSYDWSNDSVSQTMTVNGAIVGTGLHTYSVTVTNIAGCTDTDSINVLVTLPPRDLVITDNTAYPDSLQAGSPTTVSYQISNTGAIQAIASTIGYYLSSDPLKSDDDILLGDEIVPALAGGASFTNTTTLTIPSGTVNGNWYLLLVADNNQVVTESNENNNVAVNELVIGSYNTSKELQINVFLEGLYIGDNKMRKAQNAEGDRFTGDIADIVTVKLHKSDYSAIVYTTQSFLNTSGFLTASIPGYLSGSYFITLKHRNSIETTTLTPVSFSGKMVIYSFDNPLTVSGSNLVLLQDGIYAIYGGDVNQDGFVNESDMLLVRNLSTVFTKGYIPEDANGDGVIDALDMILIDNNAGRFVRSVTP